MEANDDLTGIQSNVSREHNRVLEPNKDSEDYETFTNSSYFSKCHVNETEKTSRTSTTIYSVINVLKGHIGITFIALPYGWVEVGFVGAAVGLTTVLLLNYYSVYLILQARNKFKYESIKTLGELTRHCYGNVGKGTIDALNIFLQMASCTLYVIYFGECIDQIFCSMLTVFECGYEIYYRFIFTGLILLPIFIKEYKNIAIVSLIFNIMTLFAFLFIIGTESEYIANGNVSSSDDLKYFDWAYMGLYFGMATCLYEGNGMILNFYSEIDTPRSFMPIVFVIMGVIFCFAMIMGTLSYIVFGNNIQELIIYNMPNTPIGISLKLLYMGCIMGIYVLVIMPVFHIMERYEWYMKIGTNELVKRCSLRFVLAFIVCLTSLLFHNINTALSLFGSVGGTFITFILPCMLYNKAFADSEKKKTIRIANIIFAIVGTVFCSIAAVSAVVKVIIQLSS